jgi:hypothetical protein
MKKKIAKALKALEEDEGEADAKAEGEEEGEGKAAAKADDGDGDMDDKKAKGEAEEKKEDAKACALSRSARELDLAARLHALEVKIAADAESGERKALLTSRPDFSAKVRASLEKAPLEFVRDACAKWERLASPTQAASNAQVPGGTRGKHTSDSPVIGADVAEYIAKKMDPTRGAHAESAVKHDGFHMSLNPMTREEAEAAVAKLSAKGAL